MKTSRFSDGQIMPFSNQQRVAVRYRNAAGNMTSAPPRFLNGMANMDGCLPDDPAHPQSAQLGVCFRYLRNVKAYQWKSRTGLADLPRTGQATTCSSRLPRCRITQLTGRAPTIMHAPTWRWNVCVRRVKAACRPDGTPIKSDQQRIYVLAEPELSETQAVQQVIHLGLVCHHIAAALRVNLRAIHQAVGCVTLDIRWRKVNQKLH